MIEKVNVERTSGVVEPTTSRRIRRIDHWFYIAIGTFVVLLSLAGFAPSLLWPASRTVALPFTLAVALHAFFGSAWVALFLIQAILVATRRTALHRRLGLVGAVVAVGFVLTGCWMFVQHADRGFDLSGDLMPGGAPAAPEVALVAVNQVVLFGILVGAAIWYRHRPPIHKRLMLFATLGVMTGAPIAHIVGHWPVLQPIAAAVAGTLAVVLLLPSAIYDRLTTGRVHPVSLWGAVFVFSFNVFFFAGIPSTSAWRDFAVWLVT